MQVFNLNYTRMAGPYTECVFTIVCNFSDFQIAPKAHYVKDLNIQVLW